MIVLDTHIWIWWLSGDSRLKSKHRASINNASQVLISSISCWEIAKLVEVNRLTLSMDVLLWLKMALAYPRVQLMELTPEIVVESTRLPGSFHKDPADQLIVATARILNCSVLTEDAKILGYSHVQTI